METVIMPKFGLIMTEGTIVEWYKHEGDHVEQGDPICQVETQKLMNDVEAPVSGTLTKIIAQVDDTVPIQEPIAEIQPD